MKQRRVSANKGDKATGGRTLGAWPTKAKKDADSAKVTNGVYSLVALLRMIPFRSTQDLDVGAGLEYIVSLVQLYVDGESERIVLFMHGKGRTLDFAPLVSVIGSMD